VALLHSAHRANMKSRNSQILKGEGNFLTTRATDSFRSVVSILGEKKWGRKQATATDDFDVHISYL
jgi:hypothetical protein